MSTQTNCEQRPACGTHSALQFELISFKGWTLAAGFWGRAHGLRGFLKTKHMPREQCGAVQRGELAASTELQSCCCNAVALEPVCRRCGRKVSLCVRRTQMHARGLKVVETWIWTREVHTHSTQHTYYSTLNAVRSAAEKPRHKFVPE